MKSDDNKTKEVLNPLTDIFFQENGQLTKDGVLIVAVASVAIAMAILQRIFKK